MVDKNYGHLTPVEYYEMIGRTNIVEAIKNTVRRRELEPYLRQAPAILQGKEEIAALEFPDPKAMIRKALATGNSSDGMQVGSDLLYSCAKFFNEVQIRSAQSLEAGLTATAGLRNHVAAAQKVQESLVEIARNPEGIIIPDTIMGKLTEMVRTLIPSLDPKRRFDHDMGGAIDAAKKSYDLSHSVVAAYEQYKDAYPTIQADIDNLLGELDKGIAELDGRIKNGDDKVIELKELFDGIRGNAADMAQITLQNAQAVDILKQTEVRFAIGVMKVQTTFSAISTNMSVSIGRIKAATTPHMEALAHDEIVGQVAKIETNLSEFKALVDSRETTLETTLALEDYSQMEALQSVFPDLVYQ